MTSDFDWIGGRPSADPLGLYPSDEPIAVAVAPPQQVETDTPLRAGLGGSGGSPFGGQLLHASDIYGVKTLDFTPLAGLIAQDVCREINAEARREIASPISNEGWRVKITPGATIGTIRDLVVRAVHRARLSRKR